MITYESRKLVQCEFCGESLDTNVVIAGHMASHQQSITPDHIIEDPRRIAEQRGRAPTQPEAERLDVYFTEELRERSRR